MACFKMSFWVCMVAAILNPAMASSPPVIVEYEAYFGGFHIASARVELLQTEKNYEISGQMRSRGLLDWYSGWKGTASSYGVIAEAGAILPEVHKNEGVWRGQKRYSRLTFQTDGTVHLERDTPLEPDQVTPVPQGSIAGSLDPFSAFLSMIALVERGEICQGIIPVYDGRRRFNLLVTQGKTRSFAPSDYTVFSGEAFACKVLFERIGGFRKDRTKYQETARNRTVWVARPFEESTPLPVRVEAQTDFGDLVIHLTAVQIEDRELSINPGVDNLAD